MRKYYRSMGILLYSLFFYFIVCFFFTEMKEVETGNYAGVFILPPFYLDFFLLLFYFDLFHILLLLP